MVSVRLLLVGVLALALAAPLCAMSQPLAWSPAERAAARAVLSKAQTPARPFQDDAGLTQDIVQLAQTELGQRLAPSAFDRLWAIVPPRHEVATELATARAEGRLDAWLQALSPPYPEYQALQAAARRYRLLAAQGGWPSLPPGVPLKVADRGEAVSTLRGRLSLEGYAAPSPDPAMFDPKLAEALALYQADRALPVTRRLDPATRAALDLPAASRLATLEANLERWRWLPHERPATRFELDIAAAEGRLIVDGATSLQMRAVVGDLKHKTPMFISALTSVVFDPPWNVPSTIAEEEILPKAARDPGYLARNDFVMIDGRVQQLPGPKNALGAVKFDLPSPFGVYLHDTPAKSLFARSQRALSHGCMRLEKPQALAEALLAPQGWTGEAVSAALAAGHTQATPLRRPTPLEVVYWTATVSPEGRVQFRPDVYGWDRELLAALANVTAIPTFPGQAPTACDRVDD